MPLELDCPGCQKHYSVPDAMAGKKVKCKCGTSFEAVAALAETDMLEELTDDGGLSSMDDLLGDVGVGGGSSDPFGDTDVLGMSSSAADPLALGGTSAQAKAPGAKASQTAANEAAANKMALMTSCVIGGVALLTALICLFLSGASLAMLMLFMGLAVAGFAVVACMVGLEKAAWPLVGAHGLMAVVGLGFGIYHYSQREQPVIVDSSTTPTTDPTATNPDKEKPTTPENTTPTDPNPMKPDGEKPTTPETNITTTNVAEDWEVKFTRAIEPESTPSGVYLNGPVTTLDKLNAQIVEMKHPIVITQVRPFGPWLAMGQVESNLVFWNLLTGTKALEIPATDIMGMSFDGKYFLIRKDNKTQIYSHESGQNVIEVPDSIVINSGGFEVTGNNRVLFLSKNANSTSGGKVVICDLRNMRQLHSFPCDFGDIRQALVHGNGRYVALMCIKQRGKQTVEKIEFALDSQGIRIIDTTDGTQVAEIFPKKANEARLTGDQIKDADILRELTKALTVKGQLIDAAFSPDGRFLAILEYNPGQASRILMVELASGNLTESIDIEPDAIGEMEFHTYGHFIEWTPNGTSFLLFRRTIISRVFGKVEVQMPNLPKDQAFFYLSPKEVLRGDLTKSPVIMNIEATP